MHPVESIDAAETVHLRGFGDTAIPVAGPGAPLVAEFSVAEFAAAIGLPTEAGKRYVGHAVELRYRLPRLWKRVTGGDLAAWRARRVADQATHLSPEAAGFVDRHVAPVAHKVRPAQVDRLVEETIGRFMPEEAERRRQEACDGRRFDVDHNRSPSPAPASSSASSTWPTPSTSTTPWPPKPNTWPTSAPPSPSTSAAPSPSASLPAATSPSTSPATTRRWGGPAAGKPKTRITVLHVHLSEAAIRGGCSCAGSGGGQVGRVENTRLPVTAETIREWCGRPDMQVTVKPVVDLAEHVSVEAYEVPDRVAEPVALRDVSCVFPWCTRPARKLRPDEHPCDREHVVPHNKGGPTCSCQIAPLCRRHHRLKTHGGWSYYTLEPGSYVWTSPHGYQYLRDHTGTLDISHDHHRRRVNDGKPGAPSADHPPGNT